MQTVHAPQAFTAQAKSFDSIDAGNRLLTYLRKQVRDHVSSFLKNEDDHFMLELNAGTGLDAVYFIQNHGIKIHATDASAGMIAELKLKINYFKLNDRLSSQQISYHELTQVPYRNFDYVFSNFGGLNCSAHPEKVFSQLPHLLKPGAIVTLVIMPKISPWEWLWIFRGQFSKAFRRFKSGGTTAQVEGINFTTWYFSLGEIKKKLGHQFSLMQVESMSLAYPPPQSLSFAKKFPKILQALQITDEFLRKLPVLRTWGDHYIATFRFTPKAD